MVSGGFPCAPLTTTLLAQDSTGATGAFLRPDPLLLNDLDANLVVAITGASRSKPSRGDIERFGLPTQDASPVGADLGIKRDAFDILPALRRIPSHSNADRLNEFKTMHDRALITEVEARPCAPSWPRAAPRPRA